MQVKLKTFIHLNGKLPSSLTDRHNRKYVITKAEKMMRKAVCFDILL